MLSVVNAHHSLAGRPSEIVSETYNLAMGRRTYDIRLLRLFCHQKDTSIRMGIAACHDRIFVVLSDESTEETAWSKLAMKSGGQRPRQQLVDIRLCTVLSRTKNVSDGASQSSSHNMLASA